jgi:hypothetical protein
VCALRIEEIRSVGVEKINLDNLVSKMLPLGRDMVPKDVKDGLLSKLKAKLENDPEYKKITGTQS